MREKILAIISLVAAILSATFACWQAYVSHKTYDICSKQLHLAEKQTAVAQQALSVALNELKISQNQLDKDAANIEIQYLNTINNKLKEVYFSPLNNKSLQDGFKYSKSKFLEQRALVKKYGKEQIVQRLDNYYQYMSQVYSIAHYLNKDKKSHEVLQTIVQHMNLLTMPKNINNWSPEQFQNFYDDVIINDINTAQEMIAAEVNNNEKKCNKLRKNFFHDLSN